MLRQHAARTLPPLSSPEPRARGCLVGPPPASLEEVLFYALTEFPPPIFVNVVSRRLDANLSSTLPLPKTFLGVTFSGLALGRQARESPLFIGSRRCHNRSLVWGLVL